MLFAENQQQTGGRIHYVLFNPWAVRSNEALNSFDSPLMKLLARAIYATMNTFDRGKAVRLDDITKSC